MPDPIHAVTPTELTEDQITATKGRAFLAGDDRLVCLCNEAADQVGDTPARKAVAAKVNATRKWLADRLGAEFVVGA